MAGDDAKENHVEVGEGENKTDADLSLPVDKGWAWVVMAGSFFTILLGIGYIKAFGIIFVEFLRILETSTLLTALVIGVQAATASIGGLLTQTVALTYMSVRQCVMIGSLILSLGVILSFFVTNIPLLVFTQSFLVGWGLASIANPCFTVLGEYFEKRRALAFSLVTSGANLGGILIPPFLRFLLDEYGLPGAMLIHGGVMLNMVVCGALLRPISFYRKFNSGRRERLLARQDIPESIKLLANGGSALEGLCEAGVEIEEVAIVDNTRENGTDSSVILSVPHKLCPSAIKDSCYGQKWLEKDSHKLLDSVLNHTLVIEKQSDVPRTDSTQDSQKTPSPPKPSSQNYAWQSLPNLSSEATHRSDKLHVSTPHLIMAESPGSHAILRKNHGGGSLISRGISMSVDSMAVMREERHRAGLSCWQTFLASFEISLFKNPDFLVIISATTIGVVPAGLVCTYMPALAAEKGLTDAQASLYLSVAFGCGIISKLVLSFILDRKIAHLTTMFMVVQCLNGTGAFFTRFYTDFPSFFIISVCYGFFGDVFFTMMPLLVVEILSLDKMAPTLGFCMLFHGAIISVASPFTGWIKDVTGSYEVAYIIMGVASFLSAAIVGVHAQCQRLKRKAKDGT